MRLASHIFLHNLIIRTLARFTEREPMVLYIISLVAMERQRSWALSFP